MVELWKICDDPVSFLAVEGRKGGDGDGDGGMGGCLPVAMCEREGPEYEQKGQYAWRRFE